MKIFFSYFLIFFMTSFSCFGEEMSASYRAEGLNMELLTAQMNLKKDDVSYAIYTNAVAKGLLSMFIHAESIFETKGVIENGQLRILDSVMKTKDNKKITRIPQDFSKKEGYLDYQSVLLHLLTEKNPKTHTVLASDGKRDMRITLIYDGKANLSQVYKKLSGEADKWSVRIEILSGNKKGWFFKRIGEGKTSPLSLYLQTNQNGEKSLVLGVFDTGVVGSLFIVKEK